MNMNKLSALVLVFMSIGLNVQNSIIDTASPSGNRIAEYNIKVQTNTGMAFFGKVK
jgi:hypothetical protein